MSAKIPNIKKNVPRSISSIESRRRGLFAIGSPKNNFRYVKYKPKINPIVLVKKPTLPKICIGLLEYCIQNFNNAMSNRLFSVLENVYFVFP